MTSHASLTAVPQITIGPLIRPCAPPAVQMTTNEILRFDGPVDGETMEEKLDRTLSEETLGAS